MVSQGRGHAFVCFCLHAFACTMGEEQRTCLGWDVEGSAVEVRKK